MPGSIRAVRFRQLRTLDEANLHLQPLVAAGAISLVTIVGEFQGLVNEADGSALGLLLIVGTHLVAHLKQRKRHSIPADEQITHMSGQSCHKITSVETLLQHFIQEKQAIRNLRSEEVVHKLEVVLLAEDIQVLADILVRQVST